MNNELCHCGKPLHYNDKEVEEHIKKMVSDLGRFVDITITDTMKTYKVDRHYIALHGIMGKDLEKIGFEEVKT